MADIVELKRMLASRAQAVAEHLLPGGKRVSHEWQVGSVSGDAGKSLNVHLDGQKAGIWRDFSTDEGGDLIDLWMAVKRLGLPSALDEIRSWLGVERPQVQRPLKKAWKRPPKPNCVRPDGSRHYMRENRNLSAEAIDAYKIGEDGRGNIIFPFLLPDGVLAMAKAREPVDGARPKPTAADCEPVLFGWQVVPSDARTIIITEGEFDAMSWWDYGYPAMSVPFGGGRGAKQQWIESEFDRMQRFERIYIATDIDEVGDEAASEIASRLGYHRCLRVKMPRKDANECLVDGVPKADMEAAIAQAAWFEMTGLRLPIDYLDEVAALFFPRDGEIEGYRTPYGRLDGKLVFRPGEVTIWTGITGDGKTQVLGDCTIDWIKQGARVCISSLEMVPKQTLRRLIKQVIGTDRPTYEAMKASLAWMSTGLFVYGLTGKRKVDELLEVFDYARGRYGCDVFTIDSLMRLGVAGDDYNEQEAVMFRLVDWAIATKVHVHLVAHSKKGERDRGVPSSEDIKGAMEIGANAFNVISIWRDRKFEEQVDQLAKGDDKAASGAAAAELRASRPGVLLNVAKQRNGDFEGKVGLWFDKETYRYRSSHDQETWKRGYLPEDWRQHGEEIEP